MAEPANNGALWRTITAVTQTKPSLSQTQVGGFIADCVAHEGPFPERHGGIPAEIGQEIWRTYLGFCHRGARN